MRRIWLALTASGLLFLLTPVHADDLVYARFGEYLESLRQQAGIPGLSAAIVGRTGVVWERATGYADVGRSVPMFMDTPVHIDGMTEAFSATLVLNCVEQGRLYLDDQVGKFQTGLSEPGATLRQVLTHTTGPADAASYAFRPERLGPVRAAVRSCTTDSYRETLASIFDRFAMIASVPGPDVATLVPPAEGVLTSEFERYNRVMARMATPYAVDSSRRATPVQYAEKTLSPSGGIISTARDLVQFDLSIKNDLLVTAELLAAAWRPPVSPNGQRLPHGIGWFVQTYNGEPVIWQYGMGDPGSSSLLIILPTRSLTLILLANSNGLVKSFNLSAGDLNTSPFGRLFLGAFIR